MVAAYGLNKFKKAISTSGMGIKFYLCSPDFYSSSLTYWLKSVLTVSSYFRVTIIPNKRSFEVIKMLILSTWSLSITIISEIYSNSKCFVDFLPWVSSVRLDAFPLIGGAC